MNPNLKYYLALNHLHGIGATTLAKLQGFFSSLFDAFNASEADLCQAGLSPNHAKAIKQIDFTRINKELDWAHQKNHHLLTLEDDDYPQLLKNIYSPPIVIFAQGNIELLDRPQIAMVGARHPSRMGKEIAYSFAAELASYNLTITSGLALGIDGASHAGALSTGTTLAVLGAGIDKIYPLSHASLAEKIKAEGLLLSEFPLEAVPRPENFPRRNRIISGLSLGTLVVEAGLKSGSLITAHYAIEQGREVFAIPNSIHHPQAKGCHYLIQQGAKLVEQSRDILLELGGIYAALAEKKIILSKNPADKSNSLSKMNELGEEYKILLNLIQDSCTHIDFILDRIDLSYEVVISMLLQLELRGFIEAVAGGYQRTKDA